MQELPDKLVELIRDAHKKEPHLHISFLLGSGFSRPDGMPLVGDINKRLSWLKESDFYLYQEMTAGFYTNDYRDPNARITLNDRRIAEEFIAFYVATSCGGDHSEFNYEDFFDYFNEFLIEKKHVDEINVFCEEYNQKYRVSGRYEDSLNYLNRFLNVFNQLVASLLQRSDYYQNISYTGGYPGYESFSRIIRELLNNYRVDVHSLNHDMLFDHLASSVSGLFEHFADGFTEAGSPYFGEMRYSPKVNDKEFYKTYHVRLKHFTNNYSRKLNFIKLHGSVDYFPTYLQGTNEPVLIKRDYAVGEILKEQFNEQKQQFEYINPFTNKYPAFLTGTTQKIKRYNDPFYDVLFERFKKNLESAEKLIVIGYGFKDDGINELLEKHYLQSGKHILVIDINKPDVAIIQQYAEQIRFTGAGIQETPYAVYQAFLNS